MTIYTFLSNAHHINVEVSDGRRIASWDFFEKFIECTSYKRYWSVLQRDYLKEDNDTHKDDISTKKMLHCRRSQESMVKALLPVRRRGWYLHMRPDAQVMWETRRMLGFWERINLLGFVVESPLYRHKGVCNWFGALLGVTM